MGDDIKVNGRNIVYIMCEERGLLEVGRMVTDLDYTRYTPTEESSTTVVGLITMRFHVSTRGLKTRLGQWLGVLPKRKTTYKTIRKQCAKRNYFK
jgi:hypothetical protein